MNNYTKYIRAVHYPDGTTQILGTAEVDNAGFSREYKEELIDMIRKMLNSPTPHPPSGDG